MIRILLYSILIVLIASCNMNTPKADQIVQVGDYVLHMDELSQNIPAYLDETDSTLWADDYIKKWIKQKLLILKAEANLSAEQKDVKKELEEYRNSLITYRYKNELMKQKMDTLVTDDEILAYYEGNPDNFILNQNIVKAIYIKVPVEVANPALIKDMCLDDEPEKLDELNEYCLSYAKSFDRFNDQWVSVDMVLHNTPVEIRDQERFLRRNRFIESNDPDYFYIVCIRDFRIAGQNAPVEYVKNEIKSLILNKRKIRFLKETENDIYKEGLENNRVILFTNKTDNL